MINIIAAIVWFGIMLYLDITSDYKKWKEKKPVNHFKEWVLRCLFLVPSTLLLTCPDFSVWKIGMAALMQGAIWWELFDGFYNKLRGFSWRFNGTVDPDDSWLDKILHKLSPLQETFLKWGLIIKFTILYIIL